MTTISCMAQEVDLFPFKRGNSYGFMNQDLTIAIPPNYLAVKPFEEYENTTVRIDSNAAGIIDTNGAVLREFPATEVRRLHQNIFLVVAEEGRYIYDLDRETILSENIRSARSTSGHRIPVVLKNDRRATYLDANGNDLFPSMSFREAYPFFDEVAFVRERNWLISMIDVSGNRIQAEQYKYVSSNPSDGLVFGISIDDRKGYINSDGQFEIPTPLAIHSTEKTTYSLFNEDLAAYALEASGENYKWVIIDRKGNTIAEYLVFYSIDEYQNGFARVARRIEGEYKWNFINTNGHLLSHTFFDYAEAFHNNYAIVEIGGKCALLNNEGDVLYISDLID